MSQKNHGNSKYKPEYCEMLIEYMRDGGTIQTFGATIDVTRATIYNWIDEHEDFKAAKDKGVQLAQKYFEDKAKRKLDADDRMAKNIDTTMLIFMMKTRFHDTYSEKQKIEHSVQQIEIDEKDKDL